MPNDSTLHENHTHSHVVRFVLESCTAEMLNLIECSKLNLIDEISWRRVHFLTIRRSGPFPWIS